MIFNATYALLWLVVVIQALVICVLAHQFAELRKLAGSGSASLSGLPIGTLAPEFRASELLSGKAVASTAFRGRRTVLCFLSPDCHTCRGLAAELSGRDPAELSGLVVYCNAGAAECRRFLADAALAVPVLCMEQADVAGQFLVSSFPVAVVIDAAGRIIAQRYPFSVADLLQWVSTELIEPQAQPLAVT